MDPKEVLEEVLNDEQSQAARVELCRKLAPALGDWGAKLFLAGNAIGGGPKKAKDPDLKDELNQTLGLACVVQVSSELAASGIDLLEEGRYYSAWALLRQLVECEYLCWAFSEDREEARKWLISSGVERRRMWQPRHMRDRAAGRFRGKDYAVHCEIGGHPTPRAFALLEQSRTVHPSMAWLDFTNHLSSIWGYSLAATFEIFASLLDRKPGPSGPSLEVTEAVERWRESDPLLLLVSSLPDFPDLR